jgi:Uma2 family endonuclease
VKNFQEHPQSILLTDSLGPVLQTLHPDGQYAIGQDCGIYWRETDPPEQGAEAPDWFYVPGVPPLVNGEIRRSYVLWREYQSPLVVLEFASSDGSEERDQTPLFRAGITETAEKVSRPGKYWVYENVIRASFYGIYEIKTGKLEVYKFQEGRYHQLEPNDRGHYPIYPMNIELGLWRGSYQNQSQLWLRWWDLEGNLLLTGSEQAEVEKVRAEKAEQAQRKAEQAQRKAEQAQRKAEQAQRDAIPPLLKMGLTIEQIAEALSLPLATVQHCCHLHNEPS